MNQAESKGGLQEFLAQRGAFEALKARLDALRAVVESEAGALEQDFGLRLEVDSCGKDFVRVSVSMLSKVEKKEDKG